VIVTGDQRTIGADELAARTGWVAKPEGLCKGPLCVPLPAGAVDHGDGDLDLDTVAQRLGMPVLRDEAHGVTAYGPATAGGGRALDTAEAPDLVLPDLDGNLVDLNRYRGKKKIVAFAWASW
jgi:hypothetical protein